MHKCKTALAALVCRVTACVHCAQYSLDKVVMFHRTEEACPKIDRFNCRRLFGRGVPTSTAHTALHCTAALHSTAGTFTAWRFCTS